MQVTETLSDGLQRGYTVVLPLADLDARRTERLTTLGKTLRLPGFRPGKVPFPIVKQRYGSAVSAEVVQESMSEATQKVLSDRGLRPAQQPKIEMVTADPVALVGDLEFKMELELLPDIVLPDFSTIEITRQKAEVADDVIDTALGQVAKSHRTLDPVTEEGHAAVTGEVVTIDYAGTIDGVAFQGGTGTDMPVELGGTGFIPGFAEGLDGAKVGENRQLNVTFPENYGNADVAGKPAVFDVTVKQISTQVVPPIDEELAKKAGFENLDGLKDAIRARQQSEYDNLSRLKAKKELMDALQKLIDFPVPSSILKQEFDMIWQQLETAKKNGTQDEEDKGKDDETLKADYGKIAERRVRLGLLLAEIGKINNIVVTDQELDRALYQQAMQFPGQEMQMLELFRKYPQLTNNVRGPLLEEKVVDFVLELAKVTDVIVTPEELAKDPEEPEEKAG
jgi:trigger factor